MPPPPTAGENLKNLAENIILNQGDVLQEIGQLKPPTFELPLIDLPTVYKITRNIKEYKSCGMSSISSKIWNFFANSYNDLFVHLFNLICTQAHYPDEWKIATVVPLPKTPNANKPGDLRPISLLPLPGKILEHHIHDSLQAHLDNNNLISTPYISNFSYLIIILHFHHPPNTFSSFNISCVH